MKINSKKQEEALKWIEELMSGNHKQTFLELKNQESGCMCVLGVRLDLWNLLTDVNYHEFDDQYSDYLTEDEQEAVSDLGSDSEYVLGLNLAELNDSLRLNFKELAVYIYSEYFAKDRLISKDVLEKTKDAVRAVAKLGFRSTECEENLKKDLKPLVASLEKKLNDRRSVV